MAFRFSISKPSSCAMNLLRAPHGASALINTSSAFGTSYLYHHHKHSSVQPVQRLAVVRPQVRTLSTEKDIQEKLTNFKEGKFDTIPDPSHLDHFKERVPIKTDTEPTALITPQGKHDVHESDPPVGTYTLPHPIWSEEQLHSVKITHKPPEGFTDKMAYGSVKLLRGGFDLFSGFLFGQRNEHKWLKRIIFLETVAGVPGMVAAMMRHMISLRRMQRDHGWIHTLLEEAENERMHLMTALQLKHPSLLFRTAVIGSQGVFVTLFGMCYIISPKFCHRFVGYLEEEAVKTYTKCLEDIATGPMKHWQTQFAPDIAIRYWKLQESATMRDVILAIRADEAHHRIVNHTLASMKPNQFNPYKPGH